MTKSVKAGTFLTMALCLLFVACGPGRSVKRYRYLPKAPAARAVVILQPECYFRNMSSYQVYQTWNDLAQEFAARRGLVVIGPDEYRVLVKGVLTNLVQETDLEVVLGRYGIKPEEAIAVRLTVTEAWQQAERAIVNEDGTRGLAAEFESRFEFSADVYHVASSQPLLSLSKEHEVRGQQLPTSADARPEFTAFATGSYRELVAQLAADMSLARGSLLAEVAVVESPGPTINYAFQELQPLSVKLDQLDELETDAKVQGLIEYRAPKLSRALLRTLSKARTGLLVTRAAPCTNMQSGDLILKANGEDVTRPYQLLRSALAAANDAKPLAILFRRGSDQFQAVYSCGGAGH